MRRALLESRLSLLGALTVPGAARPLRRRPLLVSRRRALVTRGGADPAGKALMRRGGNGLVRRKSSGSYPQSWHTT